MSSPPVANGGGRGKRVGGRDGIGAPSARLPHEHGAEVAEFGVHVLGCGDGARNLLPEKLSVLSPQTVDRRAERAGGQPEARGGSGGVSRQLLAANHERPEPLEESLPPAAWAQRDS